jgi:RNHCP domain
VQNRNHCPGCLWSRHLDWHNAGDRLSSCRAAMRPLGLTTKRGRNKYASERDGELMLIHECSACKKVVINRIAADDNAAALLALFEDSYGTDVAFRAALDSSGVSILTAHDRDLVRKRLFGSSRMGLESRWIGGAD